MKKVFAISILMLVCLLLPTVCFAQTQEEWNLSCTYKTSRSVDMYQYPNHEGDYLGVLPANTYVVIQSTMDGYKGVSWKRDGRSGYGWVEAGALVRCTSTVRGSSGYADSVHELDPNHDAILASKPVINVADSLLQQGDKDYSDLTFENPDSSSASAAQQTAGRGNKVEEDTPAATPVPSTMKAASRSASTQTANNAPNTKNTVQIGLVQLGAFTTTVKHEGREIEVPTSELQFSTDVPEGKQIASILAPRTGRCYLRAKASSKGDVIDKCKAGTVVQVVKYGKSYCQIVYEDQIGYVQTACLTFLDPSAEVMGTTVLTYNGRATGSAQIPVRNTASNDSCIIVKLRSGTEVTVIAKSGKWYEVAFQGMHGFVHENFMGAEIQ